MQKNSHIHYRKDIDGLRAIAVLSVIGFHAFPQWIPGGFVGVDIFFVISGYLISSILFKTLANGSFSFIDFYQRRIKRIFPALMIVLASCYIAGWFTLLGTDFQSLGKHLAYGAGFFSNFILLDESGYFDTAAEYKPLLHLWSLGIEEQFYALWPLLVVLTFRRKYLFIATMLSIIMLSFGVGSITLYSNPSGSFYLPQYRAWELLLGALIAYIATQPNNLSKKTPTFNIVTYANIKATIGLALIIASVFLYDRSMPFPGWRALLPTIGTLLLISAGNNTYINRKILSHYGVVFIGLISYPLYLWHWPIIVFAKIKMGGELSTTSIWIILLTSTLLAYLTYRFVEMPVKKASSFIVSFLLVISILIAGLGFWTYRNDGLIFRFPKSIQYLSNAKKVLAAMDKITISWRQNTCFLIANYDGPFSNECVDKDFSSTTRSLFLWGDSHAAMLYNTLTTLQPKYSFAFAQYNVASCAPLVNSYSESFCPNRIEFITAKIRELKPNTVLLEARWDKYEFSKLPETIVFLKKAGVKHIIVIGMTPIWNGKGLPAIIVDHFNSNIPHVIPKRIVMENINQQLEFDKNLREMVEKNGGIYLSALNALCDNAGCLATQGEALLDLTTLDYGHLTPSASTYLLEKILPPVFDTIWSKATP
jgi:peptidoglycan/LPS O-acetylase OafA/YrhL